MKSRIKNISLLIFSVIFLIGMLYRLFTDLNYFLTRRTVKAKIFQINESNKSGIVSLQLNYYNNYLNRNVKSDISIKRYDATNIITEGDSQISILYAKYFPNKIYIENVNAPRWLIILFEIIMILIMFFLFYSSIKLLIRV